MKKVAFLLLEQIPHVHHLATIAFEMSEQEDCEVSIIGNKDSIDVVRELQSLYPNAKSSAIVWKSKGFRRISEKIRGRKIPRIRSLLENYKDYLLSFDMIVCPDFYVDWLINQRKGSKPLFVFGFHGAGDRAYGFKEDLKDFDYLLLSGPKIENRLSGNGILDVTKGLMVGYPKFDVAVKKEKKPFFKNDLPTVVYNPHFDKDFTSYNNWGESILDYFKKSKEYNLIFAPHFNLFHLQKNHTIPTLPKKYYGCPNIHIDLGSTSSIDMTYVVNSDLYMGDVSSQVYEFLYYPRPCLFLNALNVKWANDDNYRHWNYGPVVNDITSLDSYLKEAFNTHESYLSEQQKGFEDTFSRTNESAGRRAAIALSSILNEKNEA